MIFITLKNSLNIALSLILPLNEHFYWLNYISNQSSLFFSFVVFFCFAYLFLKENVNNLKKIDHIVLPYQRNNILAL